MKTYTLVALQEFKVRDVNNHEIKIPAEYRFKGQTKTYVKNLTEKMKIKVIPDGDRFNTSIIMTDVPCSFVGYADESDGD